MWHWGCKAYQVCTNDESELTLTFCTSRPNFILNAFILDNLELFIFLLNLPVPWCAEGWGGHPSVQMMILGWPWPWSKYFYWPFQGELLLWIICVIYILCFSCFRVCSLLPCGHLLGRGWPLDSCLWCLIVFFHTFPCGILGQVWYNNFIQF